MRILLSFHRDFAYFVEEEVQQGLTYDESEEFLNWTDFVLGISFEFGDISLCF